MRDESKYLNFARGCAALAFALGVAGLAGWIFNNELLKRVHPSLVAMKVNAAICLAAAGISLFLRADRSSGRFTRAVAQVLAALVAVVGLLTLTEHFLGLDLGIDQYFFTESVAEAGRSFPGRPGVASSFNFILIGLALILIDVRRAGRWIAGLCATVALISTGLVFLYYFYGVEQEWFALYTTIALHTAVAFVSLCFGIFLARPDRGIVSILRGNSAGSVVARRMFPAAVFVPILLGWLRVLGQRAGYYGTGFGSAMFTGTLVFIFAVLIWRSAKTLNRTDEERKQAGEALNREVLERERAEFEARRSAAHLRFVADHTPVLIVYCDSEQRYQFVNAPYATRFGLHPEEVVGRRIEDVVGAEAYESFRVYVEAALLGERVEFEQRIPYAQIGVHWMHCIYAPQTDEKGDVIGFVAVAQDVTERREAEDAVREGEARLRLFIDYAPAAIAMFDRDMRYLAASRRWKDDYGLTEDIIGRSHYEIFPEIPERWKEAHRRGLAGEVLSADEDPFQRTDGSVQWLKWEVRPWRTGDASVGGLLIASEDVTARMETQIRLRESEERFRELGENIAQLAWMADANGWIFWYNRRWYEYTGATFADIEGWGWAKVHHPDYVHTVIHKWKSAIAAGESWHDVFPLRNKDGRYGWFLSYAFPLRDASGKVMRWFGTNTDITELREAQDALREADRRKDAFLAMLAHELRNPLAPIRTASEILNRTALTGNAQRASEIISRQVSHMARLLDDLLDVSRIARGKVALKMEHVDFGTLVESVVEDHRTSIEDGRLRLDFSRADERLVVKGDRTRLAQVLGNLLQNAMKFTGSGGTIVVRMCRDEDRAAVSVSDSGIGMTTDMLQHVFEPFVQADRTLERSKGGLGLGLALVKGIVDLHGGEITAASEGPDRGSTFTVSLPVLTVSAEAPAVAVQRERPPISRKILIIEDNVDAAESLKVFLEMTGNQVAVASSGPEGLALAENFVPDMTICDIGLPELNGYEVAKAIRRGKQSDRMVLVALSGYGQEEDIRRSLEAGFDAHFTKPLDLSHLESFLVKGAQTVKRGG